MDRRDFIKTAAIVGAGMALSGAGCAADGRREDAAAKPISSASLVGFSLPPMQTVRVGFVGTGNRGTSHVQQFIRCEGVEVKALCDLREDRGENAANFVTKAGRPKPDIYAGDEHSYEKLCDRDDIDLVINATPWAWHVPVCLYAMKQGRNVAVEVPMALTVDDCWAMVETAEKTRRHCMMMENCCYGDSEMAVLNMCRQGVFGDLLYGEAAYLHNLKAEKFSGVHEGEWRLAYSEKYNGNLYPTHGLGPVAQYMNINRGDKFDYLVSMSTPAMGMHHYAETTFGPNDPRSKLKFNCGDMNMSLIKTHNGRTILLEHDTTTNEPYSRLNLISGTKGLFGGYPDRITFGHEWENVAEYLKKYEHPLWKKIREQAKTSGHGGMDFVMVYRLIDCLHRGLPLDQSVYDGASWSCIVELSIKSVANKSQSMDFPDFTRGAWKTAEPLGIVT